MIDNTQELREQLLKVDLSDGIIGFTHLDKRDVAILMPIIEAYVTTRVKEAERLAMIEESKLWYNDWGNGSEEQTIGDGSWEDYYDYRIEALTTTTNGKGGVMSKQNEIVRQVIEAEYTPDKWDLAKVEKGELTLSELYKQRLAQRISFYEEDLTGLNAKIANLKTLQDLCDEIFTPAINQTKDERKR